MGNDKPNGLRLVSYFDMSYAEVTDFIKQVQDKTEQGEKLCGFPFNMTDFNTNPIEAIQSYKRGVRDMAPSVNRKYISMNYANTQATTEVPRMEFASYLGDILIGFISLKLTLSHKTIISGANIGYYIYPMYRGLGFGREQLRLLCEVAFNEWDMPSLLIDCANEASENTVKSLGGRYIHTLSCYFEPSLDLARYVVFPDANLQPKAYPLTIDNVILTLQNKATTMNSDTPESVVSGMVTQLNGLYSTQDLSISQRAFIVHEMNRLRGLNIA